MGNNASDGFVRRRLGRTNLEVSRISLGCWTLGGANWSQGQPVGWGELEFGEAEKAVERGLELGCNHFDTADVYGDGRSEQMLGKILGPQRKNVVIATKVGWFQGTAVHAYHPLHIRHQIEQSLENLKTDYVDIYYFHHGDFGPDDCYLDDAAETVRRLREEGKVRFIGQSAYTVQDFQRLIPIVEPDVVQSRAHIMDIRMVEPCSPVAGLIAERDLGFVAFSPMAQGLLLDKFRPENPPQFAEGDNRGRSRWFEFEFLSRLAPKLDRLKERFGPGTGELIRVSLQYLMAYQAVSCVIPGFRSIRQVEMDLSAAGKPLSGEDVGWIRELFEDCMMDD